MASVLVRTWCAVAGLATCVVVIVPSVASAATINGDSANNTISGTTADDVITARGGNDRLTARAGNDGIKDDLYCSRINVGQPPGLLT